MAPTLVARDGMPAGTALLDDLLDRRAGVKFARSSLGWRICPCIVHEINVAGGQQTGREPLPNETTLCEAADRIAPKRSFGVGIVGLAPLRYVQSIETKPMTRIGETVDAAKHRRHRAQAGAASNQEHHQYLVFDGLGRGHPAENLPVIMPGKETMPVAAMELMMGISALRKAGVRAYMGHTANPKRLLDLESDGCPDGAVERKIVSL